MESSRNSPLWALTEGVFKRPQAADARHTYLKVLSMAGDFIGEGRAYSYLGEQVSCLGSDQELSVSVDNWTLVLSPGKGKRFKLGEYPDAVRFPFNGPGPGMNFSGNGRGCNELSGKFVIWQLRFKGEHLSELAVDFLQRGEKTDPPLVGMVRFNSSLGPGPT